MILPKIKIMLGVELICSKGFPQSVQKRIFHKKATHYEKMRGLFVLLFYYSLLIR